MFSNMPFLSGGKFMATKQVRSFYVFIILIVLISQFGLMPMGASEVGAAPAQYVVPASLSYLGVTISNVSINGGGNIAFVSPGSLFSACMSQNMLCQWWVAMPN
jgi:hypothetical protein